MICLIVGWIALVILAIVLWVNVGNLTDERDRITSEYNAQLSVNESLEAENKALEAENKALNSEVEELSAENAGLRDSLQTSVDADVDIDFDKLLEEVLNP